MRSTALALLLVAAVCLAFPGVTAAQTDSDDTLDNQDPNGAAAATPVLLVTPTSLDFGRVALGDCPTLVIEVSNDVEDPESILEVDVVEIGCPTPGDCPFTFDPAPIIPMAIPGDGTSVREVTVKFCPVTPGTFNAEVHISSPNAAGPPPFAEVFVSVTGIGNAPPICDAGPGQTGTVGDTIDFDGSASSDDDAIVSYDWDFGDGNNGTGAMPSNVYTLPGSYVVTLTVTDSDGATSDCTTDAEIAPGQNEFPICDAGGAASGNVGDSLDFDGSASIDPDGTVDAYDWMFGDGGADSGPMVSHTYASGGSYTVTLTVTDDDGASSSCETTADVIEAPTCDAGAGAAGNVGDSLDFDGSASSDDGIIVSYEWDFGDGDGGVGTVTSHTYAAGGLYTVTLTVTDDQGAEAECSTTADVNEFPTCDPGQAVYDGDIGVEIQFDGSNSSDPDGTVDTYAWDFGDGNNGSGPSPTHIYTGSGMFTVTLCVTDDDGAESCCTALADINGPTAVELAGFAAVSRDAAVTLEWQTSLEEDNLGFNILRSEVDAFPTRINDTLVNARHDGSYTYTDETAEVGREYDYYLEAVDRFGGKELHGPQRVTVARALPKHVALKSVHPNPFNPSTTVTFELPAAGSANVTIYNAAGRPVRTLVDGFVEADVHAFRWDGLNDSGQSMPSGVYFVQLRVGGQTLTQKMVMAR